mgnify:CR=1 FL=1
MHFFTMHSTFLLRYQPFCIGSWISAESGVGSTLQYGEKIYLAPCLSSCFRSRRKRRCTVGFYLSAQVFLRLVSPPLWNSLRAFQSGLLILVSRFARLQASLFWIKQPCKFHSAPLMPFGLALAHSERQWWESFFSKIPSIFGESFF